jgi:hypothetical protein
MQVSREPAVNEGVSEKRKEGYEMKELALQSGYIYTTSEIGKRRGGS